MYLSLLVQKVCHGGLVSDLAAGAGLAVLRRRLLGRGRSGRRAAHGSAHGLLLLVGLHFDSGSRFLAK